MTEAPALFDMEPSPPADPEQPLSDGRRRTLRQLALLKAGRHPLSPVGIRPLRLHPDAPPPDNRDAPGPRCGTCRFREIVAGGNKSYGKCLRGWDGNPQHNPPFATHGAASDVRRWWPACERFEAAP